MSSLISKYEFEHLQCNAHNINISDDQYQIEETIDNVSGKLESFSLSDAIETSLNMQGMHAPVEEPRRGGLVHPLMIHKVQN